MWWLTAAQMMGRGMSYLNMVIAYRDLFLSRITAFTTL